ncbi:hypothetical protein C8R44DRAFT_749155 [Mycena epipterygia]|nr:hypothetical protein C8R44DRAFT_749155 [Mycena epipterygia]
MSSSISTAPGTAEFGWRGAEFWKATVGVQSLVLQRPTSADPNTIIRASRSGDDEPIRVLRRSLAENVINNSAACPSGRCLLYFGFRYLRYLPNILLLIEMGTRVAFTAGHRPSTDYVRFADSSPNITQELVSYKSSFLPKIIESTVVGP